MRGWSFHSVKGGVGKSTLATRVALALARRHPGRSVFLVDLDLTGTSLADGLPLQAPRHPTEGSEATSYFSVEESRIGIEERDRALSPNAAGAYPDHPLPVPFLNDWLLHSPPNVAGSPVELPLSRVAWKLRDGPDNLRVLPSSALPGDLARTVPVVFDETFSGFFEARLEELFAQMAALDPAAEVVVDVPPTIPGLSRAVLGVGLRMSRLGEDGRPAPQALALDGYIPAGLEGLRWTAFFLSTLDDPDIRAMKRWFDRVRPEERRVIRMLFNRASPRARDARVQELLNGPGVSFETLPRAGDDPFDLAALSGLGEPPAAPRLRAPELESAPCIPDDGRLVVFGHPDGLAEDPPAIVELITRHG